MKMSTSRNMQNALRQGISDLLYADDTLLVTKDTETMNALLKAIEVEPTYYITKINMGKCLTMTMNGLSHTHFQDGTLLLNVSDAKIPRGIATRRRVQ